MQRAVFYARVSTEEEKQVNALEKQVQECKDVIEGKNWKLVDQYIDEGKSGTQTKRRDEYNRLYEDLAENRFDIVVIKSQDRLMRNVKDWYVFVDRLVTHGKRLYMYIDSKFYTPDDALITGIKAILAEDYSRELSKKMSNHYRKMTENAKIGRQIKFPISKTIGLKRVNDEVVIVEDEAEIVRTIFKLYLEGNGVRKIMGELKNKGYKTRSGKDFCIRAILTILNNERYIGTIILNKTQKDFDTKNTIKNPESDWVYLYNAIPAIISQEDFDKVQKILSSRREKNNADQAKGSRGVHRGKTPISGKIYCGECGGKMHRDHNAQYNITYWRCRERSEFGVKDSRTEGRGCNMNRVRDDDIMAALRCIGEELAIDRDKVKDDMVVWLNELLERIQGGKDIERLQDKLQDKKAKKKRLLDLYMEEGLTKEEFIPLKKELDLNITEIERQLEEFMKNSEDIADIKNVIKNIDKEIDDFIGADKMSDARLEWVMNNAERIIVFHNRIEIEMGVGINRKFCFLDAENVRKEIPYCYASGRPDCLRYGNAYLWYRT